MCSVQSNPQPENDWLSDLCVASSPPCKSVTHSVFRSMHVGLIEKHASPVTVIILCLWSYHVSCLFFCDSSSCIKQHVLNNHLYTFRSTCTAVVYIGN